MIDQTDEDLIWLAAGVEGQTDYDNMGAAGWVVLGVLSIWKDLLRIDNPSLREVGSWGINV